MARATAWARRQGFNEAGAVMPRKARYLRKGAEGVDTASMRPGQLCPGKQEALARVGRLLRASMRPGQLCPGKAARGAWLDWAEDGLQ